MEQPGELPAGARRAAGAERGQRSRLLTAPRRDRARGIRTRWFKAQGRPRLPGPARPGLPAARGRAGPGGAGPGALPCTGGGGSHARGAGAAAPPGQGTAGAAGRPFLRRRTHRGGPGWGHGRLQGGMSASGAAAAAAPARPSRARGGYLAGWIALKQPITFSFFFFSPYVGFVFWNSLVPSHSEIPARRVCRGEACIRVPLRLHFSDRSRSVVGFTVAAVQTGEALGMTRVCCTVQLNCVTSALSYLLGLFTL